MQPLSGPGHNAHAAPASGQPLVSKEELQLMRGLALFSAALVELQVPGGCKPAELLALYRHVPATTAEALNPLELVKSACQALSFADTWWAVSNAAAVHCVLLAAAHAQSTSRRTILPSHVLKYYTQVCAAGCAPPYTDLVLCQQCRQVAYCSHKCLKQHSQKHLRCCSDNRAPVGRVLDSGFVERQLQLRQAQRQRQHPPAHIPADLDTSAFNNRLDKALQVLAEQPGCVGTVPWHGCEADQTQTTSNMHKYQISHLLPGSQTPSHGRSQPAREVVKAMVRQVADAHPASYPARSVATYISCLNRRHCSHTLSRATLMEVGNVALLGAACASALAFPQCFAISKAALLAALHQCAMTRVCTIPGAVLGVCARCASTSVVGRCGSCHGVAYCNEACQQADWAHHKRFCGDIAAQRPAAHPNGQSSLVVLQGEAAPDIGALQPAAPAQHNSSAACPPLAALRGQTVSDSCGPVDELEELRVLDQYFLVLQLAPQQPELVDAVVLDDLHRQAVAAVNRVRADLGLGMLNRAHAFNSPLQQTLPISTRQTSCVMPEATPTAMAAQTQPQPQPESQPQAKLRAMGGRPWLPPRSKTQKARLQAQVQPQPQQPQPQPRDSSERLDPEAVAVACREMLAENPTVQRIAEVMMDGAPVEATEDEHMLGLQQLLIVACMLDEEDMAKVKV